MTPRLGVLKYGSKLYGQVEGDVFFLIDLRFEIAVIMEVQQEMFLSPNSNNSSKCDQNKIGNLIGLSWISIADGWAMCRLYLVWVPGHRNIQGKWSKRTR